MSAAWRIPLVKLTGISPSGLNASSEGEIRVYYDLIKSCQEAWLRPIIQIILDFISIELFGDVDADITFDFSKLYEVTEIEAAQIRTAQHQPGRRRRDRDTRGPGISSLPRQPWHPDDRRWAYRA
jgi:uncharacterized protein